MTWSKAPFLIIIAACLWGTTGTAQAFAPDAASSVSIGAARLIVGGVVLVVVTLTARGPRRTGLLRRPDVVMAAVGMAAYQPLFFSAVSRTGVAVGTVIALGSAPIMTGLLSTVSGEDRPNGGWARATAFALTGIVILVLSGNSDPTLDVGGGLMALWAGGSYAAYATATRRASQDVEFRSLTGAIFLLAGIASLPVLLATDLSWLRSGSGAGVALWLGIGATAIAYLLFGRGIERVRAPSATTLTLAEPVTATLLAVVVLSERPTVTSTKTVPTTTATLPAPIPTSTASTVGSVETTTTTGVAQTLLLEDWEGGIIDFGPVESDQLAVVGVSFNDVLNV